MATAANTEEFVECGFCCRKNEALEEPKILPCSHVHCLGCLVESFEHNHLTQCPVNGCMKVFDVKLEGLPNWNVGKAGARSCNICIKKGQMNEPAIIYCPACEIKFCLKHEQWHDEGYDHHQKMTMADYMAKVMTSEDKMCKEHKDKPYNAGCKVCMTLICVQCLTGLGNCISGEPHELVSLDDLVTELTNEINDLKKGILAKEEQLEALFKNISRAISDHGDKTEEMIKLLHKTRDEQLQAIKAKYDQLEKELIANRRKAKTEMDAFMEDSVGVKWTKIRNERLKIEARLRHGHQVDVVVGYSTIKDKIQQLAEEELPLFQLDNGSVLERTGHNRTIELKMFTTAATANIKHQPTAVVQPPKSITLVNTVSMSDKFPLSVCYHQGIVYVGMSIIKQIWTIDNSQTVNKSFVTFDDYIKSLVVHEGRIYTLVGNRDSRSIYVHDVSGNLLNKWNHIDGSPLYNGISVCFHWIAACDRKNKQLTVYSFSGQKLRDVSLPQIGDHFISTCPVSIDSIIITGYQTSKIFRINITTGEVLWTCTTVRYPQGVTCYKNKYVFVASYESDSIHILNIQTGKVVSKLTDEAIKGTSIFDLEIYGDTLIVPNCKAGSVLYYRLG